MNIDIQREVEYKAKCYPDVTMKLRNLTTSEYRESLIIHPASKKEKVKIEYNLDVMFDCMVTNITNLTITDEGKGVKQISTGKDILDTPGLNELYLELVPILIKMEARIDAKN